MDSVFSDGPHRDFTIYYIFWFDQGSYQLSRSFFSDKFGRKQILIAGWIVAIPVPFLLIWAPSWGWILFANVFLGVSQGFTWSTTVIMKIDIVGPHRGGLAMGINKFAGYFAVAGSALNYGIHFFVCWFKS